MVTKSAQEFIEILGEEVAVKLFSEYGGQSIYIPKNKQSSVEARNQKIKEERLAGVHPEILAEKYNLNIRYVFKIIRDKKKPYFNSTKRIHSKG